MRCVSLVCALMWALGCGTNPSAGVDQPVKAPSQPNTERFEREVEAFFKAYLDANPTTAVSLGYHEYDGVLPDVSGDGIEALIDLYLAAKVTFQSIPASDLSPQHQVERKVLLRAIIGRLFDLDVLKLPMRSPIFYVGHLSLQPYVAREYAPVADRARAIIKLCDQAGLYVTRAQANLPMAIPHTWLDIALLMTSGMIDFARTDVRKAMAGLDRKLTRKLDASLARYVKAMEEFHGFLTKRKQTANDSFALGIGMFMRMLRDKEGIEVSLRELTELGEADLQRNLAAAKAAAAKIDPSRDAREVIADVMNERPPVNRVLAEATRQAALQRKFLIDKDIVTIPGDDVAEVRESPPFMRWNSAFLSASGPFESASLPSFYYISPPDPSWPAAQQRSYIPSFGDLFFTTAHELWPGHFLHRLHMKQNPSRVLKTFCTYSTGEGWAHYTEEMMWNQGAARGDEKLHIGQLSDALMRNVRFKSALALHTLAATVDESMEWFQELAFKDKGNAMQQAVRGTFDPGYLNYTLGKLIIMKLREDWKAKVGSDYSLRGFHDKFLSYGCAPIPVIREQMLGDDSPAI